jgi:hypothetical protein
MSTRREHFTKFAAVVEQIENGFDALKVRDGGSITVGDDSGITGTFEGTFKKIRIKNGVIIEFELEG